jgi:ankyrin repeat protein
MQHGFDALNDGDVKAVREMIKEVFDMNEMIHGQTPLIIASSNGHLSIVHAILQCGSIEVNAKTKKNSDTALTHSYIFERSRINR